MMIPGPFAQTRTVNVPASEHYVAMEHSPVDTLPISQAMRHEIDIPFHPASYHTTSAKQEIMTATYLGYGSAANMDLPYHNTVTGYPSFLGATPKEKTCAAHAGWLSGVDGVGLADASPQVSVTNESYDPSNMLDPGLLVVTRDLWHRNQCRHPRLLTTSGLCPNLTRRPTGNPSGRFLGTARAGVSRSFAPSAAIKRCPRHASGVDMPGTSLVSMHSIRITRHIF